MAKVKVRRASRDELPGFAIMRDAIASEFRGESAKPQKLDLEIEVDPVLDHLVRHDPEGFLCAEDKHEALGFGAAHIRSRQCVLSDLWVLPQHRGIGAGEALLDRLLAYGERSGAREYLAISTVGDSVQGLLLGRGFTPLAPVFTFSIAASDATNIGEGLSRLLAGTEITSDLLNRRGQADLDRIDKLTRNITREDDHQFWIKVMDARAAFIRQGERVASYAFGSTGTAGPVAGNSCEAALCGLGWAIRFAAEQDPAGGAIEVRVPAPFQGALDALLDGGAELVETALLYGRNTKLALDRWIPGVANLP